jgi:primosomal protein N''
LQTELGHAHKQIEILRSVVKPREPEEKIEPRIDDSMFRNSVHMFDKIYEKIDNIQSQSTSEQNTERNMAAKFVETMDLFKGLLISNQELRDEMTEQTIKIDEITAEKTALMV